MRRLGKESWRGGDRNRAIGEGSREKEEEEEEIGEVGGDGRCGKSMEREWKREFGCNFPFIDFDDNFL